MCRKSSPLKGCVNDAKAMMGMLQKNADGSKNFETKLLVDSNKKLNKSYLMKQLERLFSREVDTALFYFSGHGAIDIVGGYLVTSDYQNHNLGLSMNEILSLATKSTIRDKIIILDCCYSGAFGNPDITGNVTTHITRGTTIMAATREKEQAVEKGGHGVFTALMLEGLQGGAADLEGFITPAGLYSYIDKALGPWKQRPVFKANISSFTPLRRVAPPIEPKVLKEITNIFQSPETPFPLAPSFEFTHKKHRDEDVKVMQQLQKMAKVGLVVPVGEEHMYFAAIHSKSCQLTAMGRQYWHLVKEDKLSS